MQNAHGLSSRIRTALAEATGGDVLSDDKVSWSGTEVRALSSQLSQIIELNTLPGMRVGISFPNWAVQGLAILTVMAANRIPVILSYTDVDSDPAAWLERSDLALLMAAPGIDEKLQGEVPYVTIARTGEVQKKNLHRTVGQWLGKLGASAPEGTGLMMFTSGSTGTPKGIFVPAKGLLKTIDFLIPYFNLNRDTVAPIIFPICHSMALNTQFLPTFLAGGKCYFSNSRFEIHHLYRTILAKRGTFVSLIGDVLGACREEKRRKELPDADHVEHVQLAGGMITPTHLQFAKELFPNATIHKGYGLTEAIRATMLNSDDPQFATSAVGRPLPFVDIQIRDEDGLVLSRGEVGEVFIKGDNVMLGATGTSEMRVDEQGYLATGDLGSLSESDLLSISGRKDSVFKINGHRVSGIEIENAAKESSHLIKNVKCQAIEDGQRGRLKIVLFLEIPSDLQGPFCEEHLDQAGEQIWKKFQSFAHFPKEILILEHFPRTNNGKLALQKMKELFIETKKTILAPTHQTALQFMTVQPGEDIERWIS
jgi:acyl-CoA synthetase (AMP-forming)/AMP-acid ligase II